STAYVFFLLPMRAIYFLPALIVASILLIIIPTPDPIAHGAHLGGLLMGVAWIKLNWHSFFGQLPGEGFFVRWQFWKRFDSRQRKRQLVRAASVRGRQWPEAPAEAASELPQEDFISKEVDPILDKISAHGLQSLTERERKILDLAGKKMKKR